MSAGTSLYDEYITAYRHHSVTYGANTAILMMKGSFYNLLDIIDPKTGGCSTPIQKITEALDIALKIKRGDAPGGRDAYFAGFPEESLHKYATMLTRENWTVVVIDQGEKDATRNRLTRDVARILSPGTHVEAMMNKAEPAYLAGLWLETGAWGASSTAPAFGAAAFDLTTGALQLYYGNTTGRQDSWTSDDLLHFFAVHPPRELIVWWRGDAIDMPKEQNLRRILGAPAALLHIRHATPHSQGALEKPLVREDLLRRCFQPKTMLPVRTYLGLEMPILERTVTALLSFVEDHCPSSMEHLHVPTSWSPEHSLVLGNHALTQLNMITPGHEDDSVLNLFLGTYTVMGRRAMRRRLLYPIADTVELERRYNEIAWWQETGRPQAVERLRQIADLPRLHRRITTASVRAADILMLDMSYICAKKIADEFAGGPLALPAEIDLQTLVTEFQEVFDVEKAKEDSSDASILCAGAAPAVAALEEKLAGANIRLQALYEEILAKLGETAATLKLELKETIVTLTGTKALMTRIQGKLHLLPGARMTGKKSGGSLDVPALTEAFLAILRLREELQSEVQRALPPLCDRLAGTWVRTWDALEAWISRLDVTGTLARVATESGFCRPKLCAATAAAGGSSFEASGLRHPLIEAQQTRVEYVRHAVRLGATQDEAGWLIYGMNASGKSSLMKSVGIAVLLAQAGSFVPAEHCTITPFRALYTRILNTDNLWRGQSSFAVEMAELREILQRADGWSLVLGDEVCSGTESTSAAAIVGATLQWFHKRGVRYMFATHLHDLQKLEAVSTLPSLKTWHLRVRYDAATEKLIYDRTLHPGPGNSLYGLEVAKAMAVPMEVLDMAREIRHQLLGTVKEETAVGSAWNATVVRRACEICHAAIVRDLEVHHIRQRAEAGVGGRFADGSSMNALRNLIVVCQTCHDQHHRGELEIGPVRMTSEGEERVAAPAAPAGPPDLQAFAYRPPAATAAPRAATGLTQEQLDIVHAMLRRAPNAPPARIVFDLRENEGIFITVQRLRAIRSAMPPA